MLGVLLCYQLCLRRHVCMLILVVFLAGIRYDRYQLLTPTLSWLVSCPLQDMMQAWENCLTFNQDPDPFHKVGLRCRTRCAHDTTMAVLRSICTQMHAKESL